MLQQLVESYQGLARSMAQRFARNPGEEEDTVQVAMLALVKALDRYDPSRGIAFTTYAWATIEGELKRDRRDRIWPLHLPRRAKEAYLRTAGAVEELSHRLGRSPTVDEIADSLGCSPDEVVEGLEAAAFTTTRSLDAPVGDGEGAVGDFVPDGDDWVDRLEWSTDLRDALMLLPERERLVLRLRFVDGRLQREIGEELGISQMQVSRVLAQSIRTLREALAPDGLFDGNGVATE